MTRLVRHAVLGALLGAFAVPATARPPVDRALAMRAFAVGVHRMGAGDYRGAVGDLERAWEASGNDPVVGMALARCYYTLRRMTRCELVLDAMLDADANRRPAWTLKARVRYVLRDRRGAAVCLERARACGPPSVEIERLLGNVWYELGDVDRALDAYRRCLEIDPALPWVQLRTGRLLLERGDLEGAEAALRAAWRVDDAFTEPAVDLADLLVQQGRRDEAIEVLERIVDRDGIDERLVLNLAGLYRDAGRRDDAIALLEARRRRHRPTWEERLTLGRLYWDSRRVDDARRVFEAMARERPDSPELARILGEIALQSGRPDAARRHYERAIEADPTDYRSYLALFFASSRRFTSAPETVTLPEGRAAELVARAAERVDGTDFEGLVLTGVAWMAVDSVARAAEQFEQASALRPDDRDARLNLAGAYQRLGRLDAALAVVRDLRTRWPDDPTLLNFHGYLLAELGRDLGRAERLVRRALEAEPDNGYFLDSLGWVYFRMGDYPRAVSTLGRASDRVPDDPEILEHLGDALRAMKRFRDARAAYERSNRLRGGSDAILEKIRSTDRR